MRNGKERTEIVFSLRLAACDASQPLPTRGLEQLLDHGGLNCPVAP